MVVTPLVGVRYNVLPPLWGQVHLVSLAHKLLEYLIDARMPSVQAKVLRTRSVGVYQQNILLNTAIKEFASRVPSKPTTEAVFGVDWVANEIRNTYDRAP